MSLSFDPEKPAFEYITAQTRAEEVLLLLNNETAIAVDIEANSLDPYTGDLLMVQLGNDKISYLFDARTIDFTKLPLFKEILEDPKKLKLLQNGKFDYKYLKVKFGIEITNIYDTFLAEAVLNAGKRLRNGLGATAKRYFPDAPIDKSLQISFAGMPRDKSFTPDQLRYGAVDTLILFPIMKKQLPLLQHHEVLKIAKLEFACTTVVGNMELAGMYVNTKKWRGALRKLEKAREELGAEIQEMVRPYYQTSQLDLFGGMADVINLSSPSQLLDLFNNKLGLEMESTGSQALKNANHPVAAKLLEYRGYDKLLSSFGERLLEKINPKTKRVHPDFLQAATDTGRFACSNPNIQQIPRNSEQAPFRECINPEPGYKLVVADYSGFEMRILANESGDEQMIRVLNEGLDMHSYTASLMFDLPYTEDFKKKYPLKRQMAKPIGFGLMYGMGAMGLKSSLLIQAGVEIPVEEAEDLMKRYFKSYPSVEAWLNKQAKDAIEKGFSVTPAGRKRWYIKPDKTDPEYRRKVSSIQRQAKNHPIQGTNADVIKYALVFVQDRIKKDNYDAKIVLTVHDEIGCEVREDQAQEFSEVLQSEMIRAGEMFIDKVPVISDPFVGDVWEH